MQKKKFIVQFNEANFDLIKKYSIKYKLPSLKKVIESNFIETSSESEYHLLEPWIQWYSFYTKLPFAKHKTFNLGDCLKNSHDNFLEDYALEGNNVGVFGAMNLKNSNNFKVYIPDPWTENSAIGGLSYELVSHALSEAVNENAKLKLSFKSILGLILLIGIPTSFSHIKMIFLSVISFIKKDRAKLAALFDYFLAIYSLRKSKKNKLDLTIFFMNGLAHIQHHYFLNSEFIDGSNPDWYTDKTDHFFEAIKIYDLIFEKIFKTIGNQDNLWTITGLSQESYSNPFCYWRFNNHKSLLNHFIKTEFSIYPRMTRDFEINFKNIEDEAFILDFLKNSHIISEGKKICNAFININKTSTNSVFASFAYSGEERDVSLLFNDKSISLKEEIIFIALKNAGHNQKGWAFSNKEIHSLKKQVPIWELSNLII